MTNFRKKNICLISVLVFTVLLIGCNKNSSLAGIPDFKQENAIMVGADLSVTATLVEPFSEYYYKEDELFRMASEEASAFNRKNGDGSLIAEKVEVNEGLANVVFKFSGRESYTAYNEAVLFIGTVEAALNSGLKLEQTLYDISNRSKMIDKDVLAEMKDTYILITNEHQEKGPLTVETFGKILYVSDGIEKWHGQSSVRVDNVSDDLIYILFK